MNLIMMKTKMKTVIIALAVIAVGMSFVATQSYAESTSFDIDPNEERAWVINMVNHGNDPTTKIGYTCSHGHMNFGC